MDVEFFCQDRHEYLAETIRDLIAAVFETSVILRVSKIDSAWTARRLARVGRSYARLLAASTPRQQGLSVEVKTYDWHHRVPYVRIFWHVYSHLYSWVDDVHYFERGGFQSFFPAVALRDRLVIVPRGQNDTLKRLGGGWPGLSRPEDYGSHRDVVEVDFGNPAEIEDAVRGLAPRMYQEIQHEIHAYRTLHPTAELQEIAQSLAIDVGLLSRMLRVAADRTDAYRKLSVNLNTNTIQFGRWNRTELLVSNQSSSEIPRVRVFISGPARIIPDQIEVDLPALSTIKIPLSIKSEEPGEFPLELKLISTADNLLEQWLPRHNVWVTAEIAPNLASSICGFLVTVRTTLVAVYELRK